MDASELQVISETVGPFAENCYFLIEPGSRRAVVIDPGGEGERLVELLRKERLEVESVLATHCHLDHVSAVVEVKEATGAPFYAHESDRFLLDGLAAQAAYFQLPPPRVPAVDAWLAGGQVLLLGERRAPIEVIETPGHSPGSVTFHVGEAVFSGDVLFRGSIGRTDLPGGDTGTLLRSIRERLLTLSDGTLVYPGHGPTTTVGLERRTNPFL